MKKLLVLLNAPARAMIAVGLIILLGEFLIMLLIEDIITPLITHELWHFIDPILLIAIVSPALLLLIFKPMRAQQAELERQLDELRRFQRLGIGRELRMKELAEEIATLRNPSSAVPAGDLPVMSDSPEAPRHTAAQDATTQPTEESQRGALLFMLEDLETARKKIEQAHQEWMAALDVVEDPIFLHDAQFRILRCNKAYQQRAGIAFHEIIGQPYYAIFPKAAAPLSCCLRAMEKAEEEKEEEVAVGGATYRSRAFPVKNEQGAYLYSVHTLEDITERKRTENALHHLNRALKTLGTVNHALVYATDEEVLLHTVCHAIAEDGYQLAWVGYVQHDANKTIKVMTHAGHEAGYLETLDMTWADTESSQAPCGQAVRSGIPVVCQNILSDPDFCVAWRSEALKRGYASLIALPLTSEEGVFGVLCVHAAETDAFTVGEISLLEEMAADLAFGVAMLHLRLERDRAMKQSQNYLGGLRDSLEETVRAIALTVEMRDPYTAGHQRRVADLATAIATHLGLPAEQVHGIHLAGVVHDLGKINIPAEILSKPGKITDLEFSIIKIHPQAGYDILKDIVFPWPIAQMVLQHHERLDGSGYPQGLKGEAILLEARILAVADVVEAMSSHRPYRPGLGIEVALAEITSQRGSHFDPVVVDACLVLFREQHYSFKS